MSQQPLHIGIDLVDLARLTALFSHYDVTTLHYLFSTAEQEHCNTIPHAHGLAISFSGKESVGKALGVGLAELNWHDIQIFPKTNATLDVVLTGDALHIAERLLIKKWNGYWNLLSEDLCATVVITLN